MPLSSQNLSVFRLSLLLLLAPWPEPASAQLPADGCPWGTARTELKVNKVIAALQNTGGFPREFLTAPAETPFLALYAHSLWVGGQVGDSIRIAGSQYGRYEFFPGPLDEAGNPPTDCAPFDRIYTVSSADIERYDSLGLATPDLRDWPWQHGADVIDGDGSPGNYHLEGGDRPRLFGDQTAFWIMNDRGNTHLWARTEPIGLEVKAYAFGFAYPLNVRSDPVPFDVAYLSKALSGAVFFRYLITYKGDEPFEEVYLGLWSDLLLGNIFNDYAGCDTTLHLAFGYDGNHSDLRFEGRPPAVGVALLQGPTVRRSDGRRDTLGMTNFMEIRAVDDGPRSGTIDAYLFMQSYFEGNGLERQPATYGWTGHGGHTPTKFMFPGDPVTGAYWSMENMDGRGTKHLGHDQRLVLGSGPFRMEPGETQEIIYAVIWARGEDRLDSITQLRASTQVIRASYRDLLAPDIPHSDLPPPPPFAALSSNYPNPFDAQTTFRYALPKESHVSLSIYDALGRRRATLVNTRQSPGIHHVTFDASLLPAGVYIYRFILDGYLTGTGTMVRLH